MEHYDTPPTTKTPYLIATLATGVAIGDLTILLKSLAQWNWVVAPTVYLYCDSAVAAVLPTLKYPGRIYHDTVLDTYTKYNRQQMERMPSSQYANLWFEFMAQKLNLLDWVFSVAAPAALVNGILFCDADICFFAPLPSIPATVQVALSPHGIRGADEARYGKYNGGFLWFSNSHWVNEWRTACRSETRFFEQAALEVVAAAASAAAALYEFPRAHNYGWWRLWQGEAQPEIVQKEWTMNRNRCPAASGILIGGEPLSSVHTHFLEERDRATLGFNAWVLSWLQKLAPVHPPAKRFLHLLHSCNIKIERGA